ncbi:Copia protein, partial [Stegodyphus mimosarum]
MANMAAVEEFENSENPSTYFEALSSNESDLWLEAMKEEIKALHENETWELVERPKGSKVINCRWVLRKKFNPDGTVERHKARLVAKGYAQKAGFDYDETFSPVARYDTVRAVLAVAAKENLYMQQFDVKTAFLYGTLKEEVFMTQPEGFNDNSGRVCKLHKSLYGLKQAPRCWNQCFVNFMKDQVPEVSTADPCLFIRHRTAKKLLVVIYVDDGLAAGTDKVEVEEFMSQLSHAFQITRGSLNQFLGGWQSDVPCTATRPDLAYAISIVSENLENPRTSDWCAVKRIFKYLKGTVDFGLLYQAKCHPNELEVYSDADYAGDLKTRRSRTGMVSKFSCGALSWISQKQKSVVLSTTEAEYVAASESAKELIWLKHLLSDMTKLPFFW